MLRQGDVLLIPANLPKKATKIHNEGIRILGERTGHAHVLLGEVFTSGDTSFILVPEKGGILQHEEHENIFVKEGLYEVRVQREFVPSEGTVRRWD